MTLEAIQDLDNINAIFVLRATSALKEQLCHYCASVVSIVQQDLQIVIVAKLVTFAESNLRFRQDVLQALTVDQKHPNAFNVPKDTTVQHCLVVHRPVQVVSTVKGDRTSVKCVRLVTIVRKDHPYK